MAESMLVNLNSALNAGFNIQTQGNGAGWGGPESNLIVGAHPLA